ncbi:extracellular solute-binding protein [Microlunatus sp. GCM10028923]|uniref:extracellular solute-binding protein n=1 Tax=Microlunatus sp. GCM10028923 TaxID=3273400 RepID=UPI0036160883
MTTTSLPARTRLDRRTLIKAAGGTLGLAALGGAAACTPAEGSDPGTGPSVDPNVHLELPEPIERPYPDPYAGPRAYDRKPFGDPSTSFRVVVPQDSLVGDWNVNEFSRWLEQRTGVKIEYQAVNMKGPDGSEDLSKINAMLSSGDLPDAFLGINLSPSQISLYGEQELFLELGPLINAYAPVERQLMSEVETIKQTMTARDGKIYQYASISDCYHCRTTTSKTFINTDYLAKIGAAMPETTDDFRNVLRELKARNPSGKKGFLPFLGGNAGWDGMDVWFVNPYTFNPGKPWIRLNNGRMEFVANTDGWRQGMALMRSLYDDGTLTKQSFSIATPEMAKLGDQGLIGCARSYYWGGFLSISYDDDALWRRYQPVLPLVGPGGNRLTSTNHYLSPWRTLLITKNCRRPDLLVQWADYQMDLEPILRAYDTGGEPGAQWDYAKKGEKGIDGRQAVWKAITEYGTDTTPGRGWSQYSLMYRSLDFRNAQYADPKAPTFESELYRVSQQYEKFSQPVDSQLPPLIFGEASIAEISDLETTIGDHVIKSMAKFATAGLDVHDDAVWNDYMATLEKMNLGQYLELFQRAYDERPR